MQSRSPKVACMSPQVPRKVNLICIPYAGGSASAFAGWAKKFPLSDVNIVPLELPGRGFRFSQPLLTDFEDALEDMSGQLAALETAPHVLFGYSLGGLIAWELARRQVKCGNSGLKALVVAACGAPGTARDRQLHLLSDNDLVARIDEIDGGSYCSEAFKMPAIRQSVLPVLRADFSLAASYRDKSNASINLPLHVFYSDTDLHVSVEAAEAWRERTQYAIRRTGIAGGHFFLWSNQAEFLTVLDGALWEMIMQSDVKGEQ